ncbi:MAG TPA: hypothetical protein VGS28_02535 [Candidatus Saccharimonadales bacterium]|nr:hypothetical protein [Candidatus Saccharimonadales bacterium]
MRGWRHSFVAAGAVMFMTSSLLLLLSTSAQAVSQTPTVSNGGPSGQAYTISPPVVTLNTDPGQVVDASINLTDIGQSSLNNTAAVNDFGAKGETGSPNILFGNQTSAYGIGNWVTLPNSFILAPGQTKTITIPITVPKNASPGGHYGVIRFTGSPTTGGLDSVSLSASIGSLIFVNVSGETVTNATLASFSAADQNYTPSSFFQHGPINFITRVQNNGNVIVQPTGTITVKSFFGSTIGTIRVNGNPNSPLNQPGRVLQGTIRRFENSLGQKTLLGRYQASLNLSYGSPTQYIKKNIYFWVIPYTLIIIVLVVLIVLGLGIWFGLKKYKSYILKQARRHR